LAAAGDEGLDARRYAPGSILSGGAAATEVALTAALGRYANDLARGRVDPARVTVLWRSRPRPFDVRPVLQQAAPSGRPDEVLDALRPGHPQYAALRVARGRYAGLGDEEARVPPLPSGLRLRVGARSPLVPALRARLALWGDLDRAAIAGDVLDRTV